MSLDHRALISLIAEYHLGSDKKPVYAEGVCYGFTAVYLNAFFLGEEDRFYRRLDLLSGYHDSPKRLIQDIEAVRQKLKKVENRKAIDVSHLEPREQILLEIPAFFESILLQQNPCLFPKAFPSESQLEQNYLAHHAMTSPKKMTSVPTRLHRTVKAETQNEIQAYFDKLSEVLMNCPQKVKLHARSDRHIMPLNFNKEKNCWAFYDINILGQPGIMNRPRLIPRNSIGAFICRGLPSTGKDYEGARKSPYTVFCLSFIGEKSKDDLEQEKLNDELEQALKALDTEVKEDCYYQRVNTRQTSLLSICAYNGDIEGIRTCLEKGCDLHQENMNGSTALNFASHSGSHEVVEMLIAAGANINHQDDWGVAIIFQAIQHQDGVLVSSLIQKGADLTLRINEGKTPFLVAAGVGEIEMIEEMRQHMSPDALNDVDNRGDNALMIAILRGQIETAKYLIETDCCDINYYNQQRGMTALGLACQAGKKEVVELMLEKGVEYQRTYKGLPDMLARPKYPEIADSVSMHFANITAKPIPETVEALDNEYKDVLKALDSYISQRRTKFVVDSGLSMITFGLSKPSAFKKRGEVKIEAACKLRNALSGKLENFTKAEREALTEGNLGTLFKNRVSKLINIPLIEAEINKVAQAHQTKHQTSR